MKAIFIYSVEPLRGSILTSGVCTHGNAFLNDGLLKGTTCNAPNIMASLMCKRKAVQKPATENLTVFNCDIIGDQITTDFSKKPNRALKPISV